MTDAARAATTELPQSGHELLDELIKQVMAATRRIESYQADLHAANGPDGPVSRLANEVFALREEIHGMRSDLGKMSARVSRLESKEEVTRTQIADLDHRMTNLERHVYESVRPSASPTG